MATAHRRTAIANGMKRRKARKNLSAKQIKFFGTAQQKAALKRSRAAKRAASARKASKPKHRPRTVAKSNSARTEKHSRPTHRKAAKKTRRQTGRKNPGEIVSLTLGPAMNPARKKGKKMATAKKHHRRPKQHNAGHRKTKKHNRGRRPAHRNPFGGGWSAEITNGLFVVAGAVSSKLGAQMLLGANNTGVMGYAANLAVGGALALGTKAVLKNGKAAAAIFSGAVVEVILRMISDYTPFGQYVSGLGHGDYIASNWVTPQRYVDALNSAQVQIPQGWAPTTVIASAAPPAGVGSYSDASLYGGGGSLY